MFTERRRVPGGSERCAVPQIFATTPGGEHWIAAWYPPAVAREELSFYYQIKDGGTPRIPY